MQHDDVTERSPGRNRFINWLLRNHWAAPLIVLALMTGLLARLDSQQQRERETAEREAAAMVYLTV